MCQSDEYQNVCHPACDGFRYRVNSSDPEPEGWSSIYLCPNCRNPQSEDDLE